MHHTAVFAHIPCCTNFLVATAPLAPHFFFFFSSVFLAITLCVALALWPLLNCMPFSFPFSVSHLTRWRGNTGSATECIAYPSSDLELPRSLHPPQRDWCLLGSRYTAIHLRLLLPELAGSAARSFACRLLPPSRPLW